MMLISLIWDALRSPLWLQRRSEFKGRGPAFLSRSEAQLSGLCGEEADGLGELSQPVILQMERKGNA